MGWRGNVGDDLDQLARVHRLHCLRVEVLHFEGQARQLVEVGGDGGRRTWRRRVELVVIAGENQYGRVDCSNLENKRDMLFDL